MPCNMNVHQLRITLGARSTEYQVLMCAGFAEIAKELKPHIKAVVVVSAHWESVSDVCPISVAHAAACSVCCGAWHSRYMVPCPNMCIGGPAGWWSYRDLLGWPTGPALRLLQLPTGELQVQVPIARQPTAGPAHCLPLQVGTHAMPVCQRCQGMSMQCLSAILLYLRAATYSLLQGARHQGEDRQLPWLRPCSIRAAAGPDARSRHSCGRGQRHQQHGPQSASSLADAAIVMSGS